MPLGMVEPRFEGQAQRRWIGALVTGLLTLLPGCWRTVSHSLWTEEAIRENRGQPLNPLMLNPDAIVDLAMERWPS